MEKRINELISICEDNRYTDLEIKKIKKAIEFASSQHEGMKKKWR